MENPVIWGFSAAMNVFFTPMWLVFFFGIIVGWLWKPDWASTAKDKLISSFSFDFSSPSGSPVNSSITMQTLNPDSLGVNKEMNKNVSSSSTPSKYHSSSSTPDSSEETSNGVTIDDLHHLYKLVEEKDGGLPWIHMMDRSTPTLSYQAWRREPKGGPPQYRSSTIFEDATPEIVRDLFWDDQFRPKWDDMLINSTTLEECPTTGTMKVHWVRKFPFFCSDRDYVIGRRIWECGRSYYCVTKGVDCPSIPRQDKPRRVDVYYSSWCIRAVESKRGNGQLTACEVLLFHHEEMGIPWEIAKIGVRKGMWGTVQKIEPGLRSYQEAKASGAPLSRCAFMASVNSKISPEYLQSIGSSDDLSQIDSAITSDKPKGVNVPKMLVIGGAVALACSLDKGLLTKYLLFGVARKFANMGKR